MAETVCERGQIRDHGLPAIKIEPVEKAVLDAGREFGPCALHAGIEWVLGYWNGESWFTLEGDPIAPLVFVRLPELRF